VRARKSALPLTLGSDISGVVQAVGPGVTEYTAGDEVFGVTNPRFTGGYAHYAVASAAMLAKKPPMLALSLRPRPMDYDLFPGTPHTSPP
jgi:NADPH:quinone reductase-like Zn-dependent oxidoreductase